MLRFTSMLRFTLAGWLPHLKYTKVKLFHQTPPPHRYNTVPHASLTLDLELIQRIPCYPALPLPVAYIGFETQHHDQDHGLTGTHIHDIKRSLSLEFTVAFQCNASYSGIVRRLHVENRIDDVDQVTKSQSTELFHKNRQAVLAALFQALLGIPSSFLAIPVSAVLLPAILTFLLQAIPALLSRQLRMYPLDFLQSFASCVWQTCKIHRQEIQRQRLLLSLCPRLRLRISKRIEMVWQTQTQMKRL